MSVVSCRDTILTKYIQTQAQTPRDFLGRLLGAGVLDEVGVEETRYGTICIVRTGVFRGRTILSGIPEGSEIGHLADLVLGLLVKAAK